MYYIDDSHNYKKPKKPRTEKELAQRREQAKRARFRQKMASLAYDQEQQNRVSEQNTFNPIDGFLGEPPVELKEEMIGTLKVSELTDEQREILSAVEDFKTHPPTYGGRTFGGSQNRANLTPTLSMQARLEIQKKHEIQNALAKRIENFKAYKAAALREISTLSDFSKKDKEKLLRELLYRWVKDHPPTADNRKFEDPLDQPSMWKA